MQKHIILTAISLLLSVLGVAWVQPNTTAGVSFLVLFIVVLVNAGGALVLMAVSSKPKRKRSTKAKRKASEPRGSN
jgi:multisubunit Na+/H+ antiporter MnhG subunit